MDSTCHFSFSKKCSFLFFPSPYSFRYKHQFWLGSFISNLIITFLVNTTNGQFSVLYSRLTCTGVFYLDLRWHLLNLELITISFQASFPLHFLCSPLQDCPLARPLLPHASHLVTSVNFSPEEFSDWSLLFIPTTSMILGNPTPFCATFGFPSHFSHNSISLPGLEHENSHYVHYPRNILGLWGWQKALHDWSLTFLTWPISYVWPSHALQLPVPQPL